MDSPAPAYALPPRSPFSRSGVMVMRVYGVTKDGIQYPLPSEFEPKPGECLVPGCDCGGAVR